PERPEPCGDRAGGRLSRGHCEVAAALRAAAAPNASCVTSRARLRTKRSAHRYTWTDTPSGDAATWRERTGVRNPLTCASAQERMSALLAGALGPRDRLDIEGHAGRCATCANAYRDLVATSVLLDRAYAPLRARSASLSPARVRLALRIPQPVPASVRFSRITARINEFGLAAAVTAFAFIGAGAIAPQHAIVDEAVSVPVTPAHVSAAPDDAYFLRWLRLGRYAPVSDVLDPA